MPFPVRAAFLALALAACDMAPSDADRVEVRARCEREGTLDIAASDDALAKLRAAACRQGLLSESCEPHWERIVTVCVHRLEPDDPAGAERRIDVHTNYFVDTDEARAMRETVCDEIRHHVSQRDLAFIHDGQGRRQTTCGKARK